MSAFPEPADTAMQPDLSVIIISYNTRALTLRAVRSVFEQIGPSLEVIVVDNASSDRSAASLARECPQVRLLALPSNIGFARACNLGSGVAQGRFLLFLNSDAYPQPGALDALLDFARRRPAARIWGGGALHPDGRPNLRSCTFRPTLWSVVSQSAGLAALFPGSDFFNSEVRPGWRRDEERAVDVVIGHFLMIGQGDWASLGGFDPAYFMYGEDVDLCLRATRLGAQPAITPTAVVVHDEGASQPHAPRTAQILAARIRYLQAHLPPYQHFPAVWAIRLGVGLRLLGYGATSLVPRHRSQLRRLRNVWAMRNLWWSGYRL